jgi:hypothetical protein
MASYNSYSSSSSRRSHMSHQPAETIVWALPAQVQGPPSALYATYFNAYGPPNPHMNMNMTYHPRHYHSSTRTPVYPIPHPHSITPRTRRASTGEGPKVSPHHIGLSQSHHGHSRHSSHGQPPASHPRSQSQSHSQPKIATKSILKNGTNVSPLPPQTPYVLPRSARRQRGISFSTVKGFFVGPPRAPGVLPSPPAAHSRHVRFALPNEPSRRR